MTISEVLHHLVDNCQGFDQIGRVDAHKAVSAHFEDEDLHPMVPSPEAEAAADDEKAQKIADLKTQLAALVDPPKAETDPAAEPVQG